MKTNTLLLLSLLSFAIIFKVHGNDWRIYGFDDRVVVKVLAQPTVMDTINQRILYADCNYGRIVVQGIDDRQQIETKEKLFAYYDEFLRGYSSTANVDILSQQYDTLRGYHSLSFTVRFKESQNIGLIKAVWINNHAYAFQYLYNESNQVDALQEAGIFFNAIRFSEFGDNQFSVNNAYAMVGAGIILFIVLTIGGALIFGIVTVTKKLRAKPA